MIFFKNEAKEKFPKRREVSKQKPFHWCCMNIPQNNTVSVILTLRHCTVRLTEIRYLKRLKGYKNHQKGCTSAFSISSGTVVPSNKYRIVSDTSETHYHP